MRVELIRDFPLFPLGLVALPTELVPLHIFEERYKTMVARVLEEEGEFGIVWVADDGLRDVGCACEIAEVLERMPDGRLNLVARGTRPFRIEARQDDLAFPAGTVEFLADEDAPVAPEDAAAAHAAYAELVEQATDHTPDEEEIAGMSAYQMAATVDFGLDAKQGLLDLRSESARLALAARLFRAALKRLDFVERAQARARSNGRVRFPGLRLARRERVARPTWADGKDAGWFDGGCGDRRRAGRRARRRRPARGGGGRRAEHDRARRPGARRLVAALGARLADADRDRPRHRAAKRCPALPRAAGCVYRRRPRTIYIRPGVRSPRSVLLHELGHLFDLRVMNNGDRGRFRRIMRATRRKWWAGRIPLAEQFAEAYSFCARYRRIVAIGRYATYDYGPSRRQHRSVCALIVAAARDAAPAVPAPQAPPVTRADPVPPPQAPPGSVPGGTAKPKPKPTPTPTPTPRPAPTIPPVPTIFPFP